MRASSPEAAMVEWITSKGLTPYPDALRIMEDRANAIAAGTANEAIWLVESQKIRSQPLGSGCANGLAFMGSQSTWSRT